jgi:hypothetical protein
MSYSTGFTVSAVQTVPSNYSWDQGVPVLSSYPDASFTTDNDTGVAYVVGYAPAVKVYFNNTSTADTNNDPDSPGYNPYITSITTTYNWNFNDYYNIGTNIVSLTGTNNSPSNTNYNASHAFIMPGTYNVSLQHIQSTLQGATDAASVGSCFGDYDLNWFWNNFEFAPNKLIAGLQSIKYKTWDDYTSTSSTPKTWDGQQYLCLQKYCFAWNWNYLAKNSFNPVTWAQARSNGTYAKLWSLEANDTICQQPVIPHNSTVTVDQTLLNNCIVTVLEIPPVAGMYSLTSPLTGVSQLTIQLTPRTTVCGSFPIDRIDWSLGDGSPIKTVSRYSIPTDPAFTFNNVFSADPADVRNFDLTHTYHRNSTNTYPVFYPSLTCYSANTNTAGSCCITVGPITVPSTPTNTNILKARNAVTGDNLYVFDIDNNVAFLTTASVAATAVVSPTPNLPPSTIVSSVSSPTLYKGNNGNTLIV